METTYRLNTRELGNNFVNAIKNAYPDQNIEIMVRLDDDETEYLLRSPANRENLERAVKNVEQGKNIVSFENLEQAMHVAETQVATK